MTEAYVIRNQLGQYLTRKGEWVSGRDTSMLFHQPWFDQALNHLIEINSKDIELRGKVVELALDDKGRPIVLELGPDPQQPELLAESGSAPANAVGHEAEAGAGHAPASSADTSVGSAEDAAA